MRWRDQRFVYKAEGKQLSEVLTDFAASHDIPAVVADGVDGVVQASFDSTPAQFLAAVSKAYGIIWYFDGAAVYFYPARAIHSRIFKLRGYSGTQVEALMRSLQLADPRYPLRYDKTQSALLVYGPPRHVEVVSAAVESLDVGVTEGYRIVTRVVPLRYAWAADRQFGETVLPGVAALLRALYANQASNPGEGVNAQAGRPGLGSKELAMSRAYGLDRGAPKLPSVKSGTESKEEQLHSLTGSGPRGVRSPIENGDDNMPSFQADEATNAVMVRGRQDRMNDIADLIRRLDVRPTLVELEAMIIDVSSDQVDSLGIDWSLSGRRGGLSVTSPGSTPIDNLGTAPPGVFTLTTLWSNAGNELLARVNALQANGKARIVAKPRVLGVANRTAVMSEKRIVNVRVAGNLDTSLYQVEAGTDLRVTPQVMEVEPSSRIKLSLHILDGKFEDAQVDEIPVVKRTEIRTEAYMTEGESLLIGGVSSESDITRNQGVPGLSKLPLVGGLFRWKNTEAARSERLFLITPRLMRDGVWTGAGVPTGGQRMSPEISPPSPLTPVLVPGPEPVRAPSRELAPAPAMPRGPNDPNWAGH